MEMELNFCGRAAKSTKCGEGEGEKEASSVWSPARKAKKYPNKHNIGARKGRGGKKGAPRKLQAWGAHFF